MSKHNNHNFRSNGGQPDDEPDSGHCCRLSTSIVTCFRRGLNCFINFIMLLLALWMIGDQISDVFQSIKYFVFSMFWNADRRDREPCNEATLAECWDYIHITMANDTVGDRILLTTKCGQWNKATQTIDLNCKLRLWGGYFAWSLVCWLLPPVAFGSLLTYLKYKVRTCKT